MGGRRTARCYLTATPDVKRSGVVAVLEALGCRVAEENLEPPLQVEISLLDKIRDSDFVLALVSARGAQPAISFELGVAAATGKPIVLVVDPKARIPAVWEPSFTIRASPSNRTALEFQLRAYLRHRLDFAVPAAVLPSGKRRTAKQARPTLGDALWPSVHHAHQPAIDDHPATSFESVLEREVAASFEGFGADAFPQHRKGDQSFDFALWLSDLEDILRGPLLVEVVGTRGKTDLRKHRDRFQDRLQAVGSPLGLLVTSDRVSGLPPPTRLPLVFVVDLATLRTFNSKRMLAHWLKAQRNAIVHGGKS